MSIADFPVGRLQPGPHVLLVSGSALDASTWSAECALAIYESGPSSVDCMVPRAVP